MASSLRLGDSTFSRVKNQTDYARLLKHNLSDSDPLIIKADWAATAWENPTRELETLQCIIDSAKGKVIVTESHLLWRPRILKPEGLKFTIDGKEANWNSLLEGEGWRWLIKNPDWGWFINGPHWSHLMKEEQLFLEKYGYHDFFKDNDVEYVNATDEIWAGKAADKKIIKEAVESKFPPVFTDKLYGFIPKKLYKYRGSTLVSLAKRKDYQSFTMKNMFGLIPDPLRAWWHGSENRRLNESILGINKVYAALFSLVGMFEASHENESAPYTRDVAISKSTAQLDAILNHITGFDLKKAAYISLGNNMFGTFNSELLKKAKTHLGNWFPEPKKKS
jgi:hypothetical protein